MLSDPCSGSTVGEPLDQVRRRPRQMPIQYAEAQTLTPGKIAGSRAAAEKLPHQLLNFRARISFVC